VIIFNNITAERWVKVGGKTFPSVLLLIARKAMIEVDAQEA